MRDVRALLAALAIASTVLAPAWATAQEGTTEARDREARSLFEAGRTAFEDGRFADARDYFQRAYELSGRADLFYNIGSAEDRLRRDREALTAFEAYLAATPDSPHRAEVDARIVSLRAAIAEREALEAASRPAAPEPEPPPPGGPTLVWTFVAGASALAFGGVAIGTWVAANDRYAALERECLIPRDGCTDEEIGGVEGLVVATNVFFVGSLVLTGLTGLALALELTSGSSGEPAPTARLLVGPGSLGVEGTW